jgi:hypothetical protein
MRSSSTGKPWASDATRMKTPPTGWEATIVFGSKSQLQQAYTYNKSPAFRHELNSRAAKHYGGYYLILRDLENIRRWLKEIIEILRRYPDLKPGHNLPDSKQAHMAKGLFAAAVAIYGKLYTGAGGRLVKLETTAFNKSEVRLSAHNELMRYRHNYVAHSGDELIEVCSVVAAIHVSSEGNIRHMVVCEANQPTSLAPVALQAIDEHVALLEKHTKEKMAELRKVIDRVELSESGMQGIIDLYLKAGRLRRKS